MSPRGREPMEFCLNSRRWIPLMWYAPRTCPQEGFQGGKGLFHCQDCGYREMREPSYYVLRRIKILRGGV